MNSPASFVRTLMLVWLALSLLAPGACVSKMSNQEHGGENIKGSGIASPCAIVAASREQVIDLITVPLEENIHDDDDPSKPLDIQLENCAFQQLMTDQQGGSHFRMTFNDRSASRSGLPSRVMPEVSVGKLSGDSRTFAAG